MIDAFLDRRAFDLHQFTEWHERSGSGDAGLRERIGIAGPDAQREQLLWRRAGGTRQLEHDIHIFFLARQMEQIDGFPAHRDSQRSRNRLCADAVQRRLFLVDDEQGARLIGLDVPIHIDHAVSLSENVAHLRCQFNARVLIGAVDLRD